MSSWFDRLLEELQRRQTEQDARREGRPFSRGPRPVNGDGFGRGDDDVPPPVRRRPRVLVPGTGGRRPRWGLIIGIAIAALFLFGFLGGIVNLITDLMWFDALGHRDVLLTRLWSQVVLFVVGFVAFALPALVSIWLARKLAPRVPIRRLQLLELPDASRAITIGIVVVALFGALISAGAWSGSWQTILLFINGGSFGQTDPNFHRDVGFYVFDLPVWRFLQGWGVASVIGILLLSLATYAAGALRWQLRLAAPVRAHVSILGALLLVLIAAGFQLDMAELSYSTRGLGGTIQAATYTDMHAQVPAFVILTVVALAAAALLLANIWFKTLWLLAIAGVAWIGASIFIGGGYPAAVEAFQVQPAQFALERPYIAQNIAATRAAFDLDAVQQRSFTGEQAVTRATFDQNQETLNNIRLWDYRPLLVTFGQQQKIVRYYDFRDVDIDRYQVDGHERQIMLSGRELSVANLADEAKTWTNERLFYTHGYGITAVPVNAVTAEGQPDYLVSGITGTPKLPVGQPRIYFGEETTEYVVTGTKTAEFDYPLSEQGGQKTTSWAGSTGVSIGNPLTRLLFALRFTDLNLLISSQLTDQSQILFRRQIDERVKEIAPFLAYDKDPYLVSADGRLVWIQDAYTLTDRYPNAQPLGADAPFPGANYVRNSVKVVIDAYDGTVTFYVADAHDPIIAAYQRIFPGLFQPLDAMSTDLKAHLRYPEDLFTAQNETYLLYHVAATADGASTVYSRQDLWAFPTQLAGVEGQTRQIEPYYVIMKIPGEKSAEFVLIQPLVASNRQNMVAWVAARMDPGVYGQRIAFRFPPDSTTFGPAQIQARINSDSTISAQFTLWSRAGSSVVRGDLLVLPMGDSILYVEPIFLQSTDTSLPEFKRVILATQTRVAFADTVEQGLRQILGETTIPPPEGGGGLPTDVAGLVAKAQSLYDAAQAALAAGDLGTYQARIDDLQAVLAALGNLVGTASPAPSPSPGG
ncbi:MAG: UPF0182 family protein [Chloroflexi bacterium]|nr:MAG: UPF0182 family protein [Chloroflexota bacterium]